MSRFELENVLLGENAFSRLESVILTKISPMSRFELENVLLGENSFSWLESDILLKICFVVAF